MAEAKQTTIRFSEDMYRRLEAAGEVTGLPINSIVVVACLEWLDAHQPERSSELPGGQLSGRVPYFPTLGSRLVSKRGYPFDRFSERAKKVLTLAQESAESTGLARPVTIGDEHLLRGLLQVRDGRAVIVLQRLGVDIDAAGGLIEAALASRKQTILEPGPTSHARKIVEASWAEAGRAGQTHVGTEHLLLGLLSEKDTVSSEVLSKLGVTPELVRAQLERLAEEHPASA